MWYSNHSDMNPDQSDSEENEEIGRMENRLKLRDPNLRRVSFPENDEDLVTGYLEPVDPWKAASNVTVAEIVEEYTKSCLRHNSTPIDMIIEQIKALDLKQPRNRCLSLRNYKILLEDCEPLEEIFRRVQFKSVNFENCHLCDETAAAIFDMLDYYDSTLSLNISKNSNITHHGWRMCCRYIQSSYLNSLDLNSIQFSTYAIKDLFYALSSNAFIRVLNLQSCYMDGNSLSILGNSLRTSFSLKELYLGDNDLCVPDIFHICSILKHHTQLELLDISNNLIHDLGLVAIVECLISTNQPSNLKILNLWNTCLSRDVVNTLIKLTNEIESLEVLNLGNNDLCDDAVIGLIENLRSSMKLTSLGLQDTWITCKSAHALAYYLETRSTLERLDLRSNEIKVPGIASLANAIEYNNKIIALDIDLKPMHLKDPEVYSRYCDQIQKMCQENKVRNTRNQKEEVVRYAGRKMSLTCPAAGPSYTKHPQKNTLMEPPRSSKLRSPIPSPLISPASSSIPVQMPKSRFSVSRVAETSSPVPSPSSRFTVTVVEPSNSKPIVGFKPQPLNGKEKCTVGAKICTPTETLDKKSMTVPAPVSHEKPRPTLERLLSLFQNPLDIMTKVHLAEFDRQDAEEYVLRLSKVNIKTDVENVPAVMQESVDCMESCKENCPSLSTRKKAAMKRTDSSEEEASSPDPPSALDETNIIDCIGGEPESSGSDAICNDGASIASSEDDNASSSFVTQEECDEVW